MKNIIWLSLLLLLAMSATPVLGVVEGLQIESVETVAEGRSFGRVGPYEKVVGRLALSLDPATEQIVDLVKLARDEGELVGEQFLHWFLQEQREEVSSMSALLTVVERSKDNVMLVEDFLARESGGENALEQGAPPAAGGAL